MIISEKTLARIKKIVENHYAQLSVSVLGKEIFSKEELRILEEAGLDVNNSENLLELVYNHNFLNAPIQPTSPTSVADMKAQQSNPEAVALHPNLKKLQDYAIESETAKVKELIEKLSGDVSARILGIVRESNNAFRLESLKTLNRSDLAEFLQRESSLSRIKQLLKDTSGNANRDWQRVALTEMSNMIGQGSVDRIVADSPDKELNDIIVYRIVVQDGITCKHCRKFYGDVGRVPKLYRLSTILGNGSNYGKPQADWRPVAGATHPNTRTSQIVELRPGFKVLAGGNQTFIGLEKWSEWVFEHLEG